MNTPHEHPERRGADEALAPEVAGIAGLLDRLAAADGAAPDGLSDRVFESSLVHLKGLGDAQARAEALARAEQSAAMPGIEGRVAAASVGDLVGPAMTGAARIHERGRSGAPIRRRALPNRLRALVALLFFGVGAVLVWKSLPGAKVAPPSTTTEIAAMLDADLETLYSAMDDLSIAESEAAAETGSIDDLLEEGAS